MADPTQLFDKIKDSKTMQDLLEDPKNPVEDVTIEVGELADGVAAESLPDGRVIINDDIEKEKKPNVFDTSRLVHELSHSLFDDNYLDRPNELAAFQVQVQFMMEKGMSDEDIAESMIPIFDDYKSRTESIKILEDMLQESRKNLSATLLSRLFKIAGGLKPLSFDPEEQAIIDKVKAASEKLGITTYLAGGILRDRLLGKENADLDFVCDEGSEKLAAYLAKTNGLSAPIKMEKSGATMLHMGGRYLDLIDAEKVYKPVRTDQPLEQGQEAELSIFMDDAYRRDLTINSLMYNLQTGKLLDPTGKGIVDLKNHVIRTIVDPYLKYRIHAPDMLRALRFYSSGEFKFAPEMLSAMKDNAAKVTPREKGGDISARRIERELRKAAKTSEQWAKMKAAMNEVGLTPYIEGQIKAVEDDMKGNVPYPKEEVGQSTPKAGLKAFTRRAQNAPDQNLVNGPQVQIDPSIQHDIQSAVDDLKKMDSNFFKGVSKIQALQGGPFGEVESQNPTVVQINLAKIKQEVQQQMGGQYNANDPAHKKAFDEATKRAIVETISHEAGHVKDFDSKTNKFPGGEGVAESAEQQALQKLYQGKPISAQANTQYPSVPEVCRSCKKGKPTLKAHSNEEDMKITWWDCPECKTTGMSLFDDEKEAKKKTKKASTLNSHDVSKLVRYWAFITYGTEIRSKAKVAQYKQIARLIEERLQELGMSKNALEELAWQLYDQRKTAGLKSFTKIALEEVATIAPFDGDKLLMGLRNDNQSYTLPGGHLEDGEAPAEAAVREMQEETGIEVDEDQLDFLGSKTISNNDDEITVHSFTVNLDDMEPITDNDPDNEIEEWVTVNTSSGELPTKIKDNLHNGDKDITLQFLGLQPKVATDFAGRPLPNDSALDVGNATAPYSYPHELPRDSILEDQKEKHDEEDKENEEAQKEHDIKLNKWQKFIDRKNQEQR